MKRLTLLLFLSMFPGIAYCAVAGLVTGAPIRIYVDDSERHNGVCYGYRVQLAKPE